MDLLEMARVAGLVVLLDARIGQQTYTTVTGSLAALERFEALCRAPEGGEAGPAGRQSTQRP